MQTHSLTSGHDADGKWVLLQDKSVGDAIIRSNQALAMPDGGKSKADIGKYGLLWISYMKENHPDRYRHHIRMGQLYVKAQEVNEVAYEMLDRIMNQYLAKHKPKDKHSTMEMWRIQEQAKRLAEEVIYGEIVYQYH